MGDATHAEAADCDESTSPMRPVLRQRAPTINIDNSAVSILQNVSILAHQPSLPSELRPSAQQHHSPSIEDRPLLSSESRPTSSHYISLQTSRGDGHSPKPHNLLVVPDTRPRGGSLDTHSLSSYDGDTLLPTSSVSTYDGCQGELNQAMSSHELGNDDLLRPQLGEEHIFHIEDNPFAFSPGQLSSLFESKSLSAFCALGGLQGLVRGLRTDRASGLSVDETTLDGTVHFNDIARADNPALLHSEVPSLDRRRSTTSRLIRHTASEPYVDRKRVFGISRLPERQSKGLLQIMWINFNDKVLIILTVVAAISLVLGLYQDFGQQAPGPKVRWVEGVTIMIAVSIVVVVGSLNDYQKEQQFIRLGEKKADRKVEVIRSGYLQQISVYDVLAGDLLNLQPGDLVPADGVLISGHGIRCDESSVTGESDQKKKLPGDEVMDRLKAGASPDKIDPFIISGSKVLEGTGLYLVTGVGLHSSYGKLILAATDDAEATPTPLQMKLNVMAEQITKCGSVVALLLFLVLVAKFFAELKQNPDSPAQKAQDFLQIVIVTITIIVIAVPEGLPLAVTLALAFAMTRMVKDHNLVRVLSSCETMGNATTICSDKTGTLTTNKMTVVAGSLGVTCQFGVMKETVNEDQGNGEQANAGHALPVSFSELSSALSPEVKDLLLQSIAINSTAFESDKNGKRVFVGSKTETALLSFAKDYLAMRPVSQERANATIVQIFPFGSGRKCMASVVRLFDGTYRMYAKGASEILLDKCTEILVDPARTIKSSKLTKSNYNSLSGTIDKYSSSSLRTIALVYRDFEYWPPYGARVLEDDSREAVFEDIFEEMIFLSIVGIQDPLRPGVKKAVGRCQHAGVYVRMVTGDNRGTAKAIAEECGIYTDGVILEGPDFRKLSRTEMDRIIPKMQVLARSSPEDKRILVKRLKDLGEIVAVTGDGTNDGPALRAADVGFSMGISGTEVAREASSIILMDDNFSSIIKALEWGRAVNDSVKKFLQFQLTVNITAVGITFISAISNPNEEPILTPVQLLWVNLIMDTFAALALATDPPTPSVLERKPEPSSGRLITLNMWKIIIGQSIYQLIVTLVLNFGGNEILGYKTEFEKSRLETLVFNIYVWMQVFNQLNNRRLDNKFNIFEGISKNWFFIGINIITVCGQVIIVNFGSSALSTVRLDAKQWGLSIFFGVLSLPIAVLIRLIPDDFIRKFLPAPRKIQTPQTARDDPFEWNDTLKDIRNQLTFFKNLRGRQFNPLIYMSPRPPNRHDFDTPKSHKNYDVACSRSNLEHSNSNSALGPAAVMAGIVAGSIGGWLPIKRDAVNDEETVPLLS